MYVFVGQCGIVSISDTQPFEPINCSSSTFSTDLFVPGLKIWTQPPISTQRAMTLTIRSTEQVTDMAGCSRHGCGFYLPGKLVKSFAVSLFANLNRDLHEIQS